METTRLAAQRFGEVAEEYLKLWTSTAAVRHEIFADWLTQITSSVLTDVANLWLKSELHAVWFKRACEPKVNASLTTERDRWVAKARALELQQLEGRQVEESPAWYLDSETQLAQGKRRFSAVMNWERRLRGRGREPMTCGRPRRA